MNRLLLLTAVLAASVVRADFPTKTEAMALAFPGATAERAEYFLTPAQLEQTHALAHVEVKAKIVVAYTARKDGKVVGVAIFDTHVVRTAPETVMVALSPEGKVVRVEVVQFREPAEYVAPGPWVAQLHGQSLGPSLSLAADVKPLSGASLTAQALVDATRRCLALFRVLKLGAQP